VVAKQDDEFVFGHVGASAADLLGALSQLIDGPFLVGGGLPTLPSCFFALCIGDAGGLLLASCGAAWSPRRSRAGRAVVVGLDQTRHGYPVMREKGPTE
jgi:hypothetical protein